MKLAYAVLLLTSACAARPDDDDTVGGPDTDPTPAPDDPPAPAVAPSYSIASSLDVQAAVALPQNVYDAIDLLRGLRDAPGETMFDLAETAGVPAVGTIRDALPSTVENKLYGWIDGYAMPHTAALDPIIDASELSLGSCELTSTLTLEGGVATHRLDTIGFAALGYAASYDLDAIPSVITTDVAPYTTAGDQLAIGDHTFGLPYGELALRAIEDALVAQRGTDLRGTLGALLDCPALAATIADKCVLGVCVGHEAQLLSVCEGALDYAVGELRAKFIDARFDAIALHAGTATIVDGGLTGGVWTAELDAGLGARPAPATFASY